MVESGEQQSSPDFFWGSSPIFTKQLKVNTILCYAQAREQTPGFGNVRRTEKSLKKSFQMSLLFSSI